MKTTITTVVLLLWMTAVAHAARLDTSYSFSTIEAPHVSVHYHQGLETIAQKAAAIAEEVHGKLSREFAWQPAEKTELVLIDDSDFSNGFATALPYNTIYVQVVPPGIASTLGEYDDWLRIVITHEYAHIVTLDPVRDYWKVMRTIFGKTLPGVDGLSQLLFLVTAPPNSFLPHWWHEGAATWAETEYSGRGRGRSSYYDMIFRMAAAERNFPTLGQINGDGAAWPSGHLPYIFGYRLQQYIADTYGKESLGTLNIAHSGRFPYFINAPPEHLFGGKGYPALYNDMINAVYREQSQRIAALGAVPFTPLQTVSKSGEQLTNPRFSPDGSRIAFTRHDPHDHAALVITDASGAELANVRRNYSDGSVCWSPDGSRIYFTQSEINNGYNVFQDLYVYDIARGAASRLTTGRRLGDVDISPDGSRFAAVVSSRGSQNLVLLDVKSAGDATASRQVTAYVQQRVASPRWSPDGTTVSYTVTDNDGQTSLHLFEVASGADRTLFTVPHTVAWPVWIRDGSALVYVSDETGVFNLFAHDLKEGRQYQVSHLLGGALQPDLSPDGKTAVFSSYDSRGFSIARIALDREKWSLSRGPSLPAKRAPEAPASAASGDKGDAAASSAPPEPYSSLRTALPHFWLPRISSDGSGSSNYGLFTAGADVLGYHSYTFTADYSSGRSRGYFDLVYQNDYFYPSLFVKAHAKPVLYANLLQRGDYYELDQGVTVGASVPINRLESSYRFIAGYQLQDQKALTGLDSSGRFNGISVFQGRQDNLFAGISFDNVLKYPYSVSSEEGRRVSLLYRRFDKALGSDLEMSQYSAEYQEFLRLPPDLLRHHVLYLRFAGAASDSSSKYGQQSFQIGGVPSELNPYPLRGYKERSVTGTYIATGTFEYRLPLTFPMRGSGTFPFFTEKLHGALFVDAGEVWDDHRRFSSDNIKVGTGAELRMDVTLGYWLKVTPAFGVAQGLNSGGVTQVYLTVYVDL